MGHALENTTIVITGASGGVGRATALAAARQGANVALLARRRDALTDVARACERAGSQALPLVVDVTDADAMADAAATVVESTGGIDTWVNNAAVHLFGPIETVPVEDWHRVIETNVFGTYHGVRAALPWMRDQGKGVIVNVSSVLGRVAAPQQSAYAASKYAIRAISDSVRQEVRDAPGIAVCSVLPGPLDTPLFDNAGNYSGRGIQPLRPVIDADRVATEVLRCAVSPRREFTVGVVPSLTTIGARIAPGTAERLTARVVGKDHFADEPAQPTHGNLHEPAEGSGAVSGGWNRQAERSGGVSGDPGPSTVTSRRSRLVAAAAAAGVVGGAVSLARRARR